MHSGHKILLGAVFFIGVATPAFGQDPVPRRDMKRMAVLLGQILPLGLSDTQLERPAARAKIAAGLSELEAAAHRVERSLPKVADDPIMKYVPTRLAAEFAASSRDLKAGRYLQFKGHLQRSASYCISCHTRTAGGVASISINPDFGNSGLSALDKAEFFAATRQFPKAIVLYEATLNDPWFAQKYPHRWERAATKMLAITVRVEQKPRLALELLAKIRDSKTAPAALRRDTAIWRNAAKSWSEQPADSQLSAFDQAKSLYQAGENSIAKTGSADAGLIEFLRASSILHGLLLEKNPKNFAELAYFAGLTGEKLASLNLWTMHEIYFEACIRDQPHSPLAKRCYERFKASQLPTGVTDQKVLQFPDDVEQRLDELKALAS